MPTLDSLPVDPPTKLQAYWAHRQGLDGRLRGASAAQVLQTSGWARSVGGCGPYLTLFSRAGIDRQAADRAVAQLQLHELPSARGCTYVVPHSDFALAMTVGAGATTGAMRTARSVGVTDTEVELLCQGVRKALTGAELEPDAIRDAVGSLARNLGEAGKKKGVTTTLPLALGQLQALGEIRRVPTNGRLDQQRYRYARWPTNLRTAQPLSQDQAYAALASQYFSQVGPATVAEFQWFTSLSAKAAQPAVHAAGLVPSEPGSDRLLPAELVNDYAQFKVPNVPNWVLVSSLDPICANRRDIKTLLAEQDYNRPLFAATGQTLLADLPHHAILDRGRLVGVWEYDFEAKVIVWASFVGNHPGLVAAVATTEAFVRDQLGDARSFSLDSPTSRVPKLKALRDMGGSSGVPC